MVNTDTLDTLDKAHPARRYLVQGFRFAGRPAIASMIFILSLLVMAGVVHTVNGLSNLGDQSLALTVAIIGGVINLLFLGIIIFLSQEAKRIQKLDQSRTAEFTDTMAIIGDCLWDWNVPDNVIRLEYGWGQMLGFADEEVVTSPDEFISRLHPDEKERVITDMQAHLNDSTPVYAAEHRLRHKNGSWIWVRSRGKVRSRAADGKPLHFIGTHVDITSRHQAEQALAEVSERLRVTLRSIGDAVIATDVAGGITLMNPVAEQLTGWTLEQARGQALSVVFHIIDEHTNQPCPNPVDAVLRSGGVEMLPENVLLVSRNGPQRLIGDSGAPIVDATDTIIGVIVVFRDITARRRLEENQQTIAKLQAIGVLAGGIAHDFNNLLCGAFGMVELALLHLRDKHDAEAGHALKRALTSFDRATGITKQLLTFAKGGTPIRKTQTIDKILAETVRFSLSGSNIRLNVAIATGLWPCKVDAGQIGQVIENLTLNARQAMLNGGTLTITADNVADGPAPLPPGRYVRVILHDTGCGISLENLNRIYDPFFTTKSTGSGLGLAAAFSITKQHHGSITVDSKVGQGTAFTLHLPAVVRAQDPAPSVTQKQAVSLGHFLLMDDEQPLRELVHEYFTDLGYEVCCVADSSTAIAAYRSAIQDGWPFQLILLDLTIPGAKGGQETLVEIMGIDPHVHALALSGYAEAAAMTTPAAFGFIGAISKPFRIQQLSALIKQHLLAVAPTS